MYKKLPGLLLLLLLSFFQNASANPMLTVADTLQIPVYNFDELEPMLHQNTDTVYVVNFWATWCKPCVAELPYFTELQNKYKDKNLKLILVSLDFKKQIEKKLIPFVLKNKLEEEVVVLSDPDANTWVNKVSPKWSGAIPATLMYYKSDRIFEEVTFENFEELDKMLLDFCEPK